MVVGGEEEEEDVPKPVRHRRDDMEPGGAAVPGGVLHVGRQAGLCRRGAPVQDPRRAGHRQQGRLRPLLPPAQGLQDRRPRRRHHRQPHRRRPSALSYLRSQCTNYSFVYECPLPVYRLVVQLADKAQVCFFFFFSTFVTACVGKIGPCGISYLVADKFGFAEMLGCRGGCF